MDYLRNNIDKFSFFDINELILSKNMSNITNWHKFYVNKNSEIFDIFIDFF